MDEQKQEDEWLLAAKRLDAFRILPRVLIAVYFGFFIKAWYHVMDWFIKFDWNGLPNDPIVGAASAAAVAGFPAIILGILTKVLKELTDRFWHDEMGNGGGK